MDAAESLTLRTARWLAFASSVAIVIAFSGNPAAGWPQIKKIYVFTQLLIVFSLLNAE
jgi:hypothetical protein